MTHAPQFWANKLPAEQRGYFWILIAHGFGGETAYCRTLAHTAEVPTVAREGKWGMTYREPTESK